MPSQVLVIQKGFLEKEILQVSANEDTISIILTIQQYIDHWKTTNHGSLNS